MVKSMSCGISGVIGEIAEEFVVLVKGCDNFSLAKCTVRLSTNYGIIACYEDIYGRYCIHKRKNVHFHP